MNYIWIWQVGVIVTSVNSSRSIRHALREGNHLSCLNTLWEKGGISPVWILSERREASLLSKYSLREGKRLSCLNTLREGRHLSCLSTLWEKGGISPVWILSERREALLSKYFPRLNIAWIGEALSSSYFACVLGDATSLTFPHCLFCTVCFYWYFSFHHWLHPLSPFYPLSPDSSHIFVIQVRVASVHQRWDDDSLTPTVPESFHPQMIWTNHNAFYSQMLNYRRFLG